VSNACRGAVTVTLEIVRIRAAHRRVVIMRNLTMAGLVLAAIAMGCVILAPPASAWDHHRRGFILGGAFGAMSLWDPIDKEGIGWPVGAINIGYAPSDQLMIYYTSRNLITPTIMASLSFAADYYMKPEAPCFFFRGGGGVFGGMIPVALGYAGYSGYSGVGVEFARHWGVAFEAGYTWFGIGTEERVDDYDGLDARLVVSFTGY
jgi:hypothetical protein